MAFLRQCLLEVRALQATQYGQDFVFHEAAYGCGQEDETSAGDDKARASCSHAADPWRGEASVFTENGLT
jgi:hypothetical protein